MWIDNRRVRRNFRKLIIEVRQIAKSALLWDDKLAKKIYDIFCTENVTTHFIAITISSCRVKVDLKVLKGKRFMDCPFWRGTAPFVAFIWMNLLLLIVIRRNRNTFILHFHGVTQIHTYVCYGKVYHLDNNPSFVIAKRRWG